MDRISHKKLPLMSIKKSISLIVIVIDDYNFLEAKENTKIIEKYKNLCIIKK